jgi:hypothetical protein
VVQFLKSRDFVCWEIDVHGSLLPTRWEKLMQDPEAIRNVIVSRHALE